MMKSLYLVLLALVVAACSSCAARQYPHEAPTMMDVAVVRLVAISEKGEPQGYCTGWKLDENRIATAGHCCEYEEVLPGASDIELLFGTAETETKDVSSFNMEGKHAIPGASATILYKDTEHDICVLKGQMAGPPIPVAAHDPAVGERVFTAGYPKTTFLITEGIWSGRDENDRGIASTGVWGGASGSPILNHDGEAVGVLAAYKPPMSNLTIIAPVEWLRIAATVSKTLLHK